MATGVCCHGHTFAPFWDAMVVLFRPWLPVEAK
jgi:hypothetical protein